MINIYAAS